MESRYYSKTPKARALLKAWTRYRKGRGTFPFEQAERLFLDVPDRRDWALILDGLPNAAAAIARLSDAMDRTYVTPNGLLRPRASGKLSEAAAINCAWAMVDRWQAVADALTDPRNVYEGPPREAKIVTPSDVRIALGEAYTFSNEVCDALGRQVGRLPKSEVPSDIRHRLARAIRSGSEWEIADYVLNPMFPGVLDPVPEYELYLGGYEMAFGTDRMLLIAPLDPVYWE